MAEFLRALRDLGAPDVRVYVIWTVLISVAVLAATVGGSIWILGAVAVVETGWLDGLLDVLGGIAVTVLAVLIFPALTGLVSALFLDAVVDRIEARDFPALPKAAGLGLLAGLRIALRFALVMLFFNLVALVVVWFVPVLNVAVFLLVNGYLLGREYYEMVSLRRWPKAEADARRRRSSMGLLVAGLPLAVAAAIPVVNALVPILGAIHFTRVTHRLAASAR